MISNSWNLENLKCVAHGSAKDLYVHPDYPDRIVATFSDRVSVFDYGAVPEALSGRGALLQRIALSFEALFDQEDVPTAFDAELSRVSGHFVMRRATQSKFSEQIDKVGTAKPHEGLRFIPLEVIFRWGVPPGSSFLKRHSEFKAFHRFPKVFVEFSTKFEASDRYLSKEEAERLAGSPDLITKIEHLASKVALLLKQTFKRVGLELWDGKIECALDQATGEVVLVDAITPDELRVTFPGIEEVPLSKELLRLWLGSTLWGYQVAQEKKKDPTHWKSKVLLPPKLGNWRTQVFLKLYESLAVSLETRSARPLVSFLRGDDFPKPLVAILGGGGREAALKWRLELEGCETTELTDHADVVLISQDADLAAGKVDALMAARSWISGASQLASKIEWSKKYGREVARAAGVPIPQLSENFESIRSYKKAPVIKFDGLAAGKGVVVAESFEEAEAAFDRFRAKGLVLVEERLQGVECSAFFYVRATPSGSRCYFLGTAQDYKRRYAGDDGPNTGGMGARCPHPKIEPADVEIFQEWAEKTVSELERRGTPYEGVLYLGTMKDKDRGWVLIEYNARPGDPETQALVLSWPASQKVLRFFLGLDLKSSPPQVQSAEKVLCLSLVRPEYPDPPLREIHLPVWNFQGSAEFQLFRNQSQTGRVAYLASRQATDRDAADQIFASLIESPWKEILEWRADLLP